MGRSQGAREKWVYEVESVRRKSFECRLTQLVRQQYGVCEAEAVAVVQGCLDYQRLGGPGERGPLDVRVDVPKGRALGWKVSLERAVMQPTVLSPLAGDDAELMLEFGIQVMQSARAVRLVEQTDRAGGTMPLALLTSLTHLGTRTLSRRLEPLWSERLYLPVVGIPRSGQGRLSRMSLVLRGHLEGRTPRDIRQRLLLSQTLYRRLLGQATAVACGYTSGQIAEELSTGLGLSPVEVDSVLEVVRTTAPKGPAHDRLQALLDTESRRDVPFPAPSPEQRRAAFEARLIRRHAFSPTRAALLAAAVDEITRDFNALDRPNFAVVVWAVREGEPPGKSLEECALVAVRLPFFEPASDLVARGTSTALKLHKASRFATEARRQGALLTLADLAFLLGMGTSALQKALRRQALFLPTRGSIMDIGPGVTHRATIVKLYVEGYTEPQIVARTHHSYDSVAAYVSDFRRVMVLVDKGLPPAHIRKVLRMSRGLVDAYVALYREVDVSENQWKLNLMRQAAHEQEKKRRRSAT